MKPLIKVVTCFLNILELTINQMTKINKHQSDSNQSTIDQDQLVPLNFRLSQHRDQHHVQRPDLPPSIIHLLNLLNLHQDQNHVQGHNYQVMII